MTRHCCEALAHQVAWRCDQHEDPFTCPDALILYDANLREYGLVVHDGGTSTIGIGFCPWCGRELPPFERDRRSEELEAHGP